MGRVREVELGVQNGSAVLIKTQNLGLTHFLPLQYSCVLCVHSLMPASCLSSIFELDYPFLGLSPTLRLLLL